MADVTDKDREAARAARNGVGPDSWSREGVAQAIAAARAEGAAEEREACEAAVDAVCRKFRAAHDPMSENAAEECYAAIRARGEQGGK